MVDSVSSIYQCRTIRFFIFRYEVLHARWTGFIGCTIANFFYIICSNIGNGTILPVSHYLLVGWYLSVYNKKTIDYVLF